MYLCQMKLLNSAGYNLLFVENDKTNEMFHLFNVIYLYIKFHFCNDLELYIVIHNK